MSKLANLFCYSPCRRMQYLLLGALIVFISVPSHAQNAPSLTSSSLPHYQGIGRIATPAEVNAWDIDVRPDFVGLPKGSGSVAQGQALWDIKCASCHGTFGESNEIFTPIVGGTTLADMKSGRVLALNDNKQPQRTTLMKVSTLSSLWDYIYRAMPWNAPRSLSSDDTFALLAYILSLAEIVPDNFVLNNVNIFEVQQKMPNRNGMTLNHGLWDVAGKPDIQSKACMNNCVAFVQIGSSLPDYARNAHGNLAEQNREYGPYRGVNTTQPPLAQLPRQIVALPIAVSPSTAKVSGPKLLFKDNHCSACHADHSKLVGPSITDVATKYRGQSGAEAKLVTKVKLGGSGVWGSIPMPPHPDISSKDLQVLVHWMLTGE